MNRPAPASSGELHLSVVRGPDEQQRWYWRIRDGERKTVWTGWATRPEALRSLQALTGEPEPAPTLETVADLLRVWVAARDQDPELSPVTKRNYRGIIAQPVRVLGDASPASIDQPALESYRNTRLGEGASPRTVRQELLVVRLAWRWAIGRELLHAAALPPVRLKTRGYVLNHRTPTEPEAAEVLGHMQGEALLATQILAVTGARISEVMGLRRCDVDLQAGWLNVGGKVGERQIPLTPGLRRLVQHRAGADTRKLIATNVCAVRIALGEACARAGIPAFTPHGLRRMVVNRLNRAGVDPKVAAAVTGHSVEVMLSIYRSVSADEKVKGVRQAGLGQRLTSGGKHGQPQSKEQLGAQST